MICLHDRCDLRLVDRHPWHNAVWLLEHCKDCGAKRIVESVMEGDEDGIFLTLPWRKAKP